MNTPAPPAGARRPTLSMERTLRAQGHMRVAGLDEVGRGAWAGPLTIGIAVVKPRAERSMPAWLRDSKQLSEERREEIFEAVSAWCVEWSVGHASPGECDEWGMTKAWRVAAERASRRVVRTARCAADRRSDQSVATPLGRTGWLRWPCAARGPGRCPLCFGGRSVGSGQGQSRPTDAGGRRALPGLQLRAQQGVPVSRPSDGPPGLRPLGHPPSVGLRRRPRLAGLAVETPASELTTRTSNQPAGNALAGVAFQR